MSQIQSFWTHCERTSLGLLKETLLSMASTGESVYLLQYVSFFPTKLLEPVN